MKYPKSTTSEAEGVKSRPSNLCTASFLKVRLERLLAGSSVTPAVLPEELEIIVNVPDCAAEGRFSGAGARPAAMSSFV